LAVRSVRTAKLVLFQLPPLPPALVPPVEALCAAADCARAAKLPLLTRPPLVLAVALWMRDAAAWVIDLPPPREPELAFIFCLSFHSRRPSP